MKQLVSLLVLATLSGWVAEAQSPSQPDGRPGQLIEWLTPAPPPNKPQTSEEQERGKQFGRKLPEPEILQPTLDPSLPDYQPRKGLKLTGSFKGAASDVMPGLVKLWIDAFTKYYPDVKIEVPPPYAGSLGAKELVKGNLDFVFVSRELKPDDITEFKAKFGYEPLSVPISGGSYRHYGFLDAVGFFVNKDNPLEKLSFDQLDAILSATHHRGGQPISTWGQLGLTGEWADKPIHIYGIKPWNGFEEFIRQRVLSYQGKRGEWRDNIHFDPVVFPIARRVAEDRYGIGYSGLAFLDSGVKLLPLGATANSPFISPTYENVANASYPLSRVTFFNTNSSSSVPLNPALSEFLHFILSRQGQQIVLDHAIYLPLRGSQIKNSMALLGK
jgi:phosphate transport system substrate-binding protein